MKKKEYEKIYDEIYNKIIQLTKENLPNFLETLDLDYKKSIFTNIKKNLFRKKRKLNKELENIEAKEKNINDLSKVFQETIKNAQINHNFSIDKNRQKIITDLRNI